MADNRTFEKRALPTGEAILMQLCRPPKPEDDNWQGHPKPKLTFMFQVADRKFPRFLKQGAWKSVNAFIAPGKDGKRATQSYELLESMNGRKLGPEWNRVDGWAMTESEWQPWLKHYPVIMDEPVLNGDGTLKSQRIKSIFSPSIFPMGDRAIDITDVQAVEALIDEVIAAERATLGLPVPTILKGSVDDTLIEVRGYVDRKNGFGKLANEYIRISCAPAIRALPEDKLKHLKLLLEIRSLWHQGGRAQEIITQTLAARQLTVEHMHLLPPMETVVLVLAARRAAQGV